MTAAALKSLTFTALPKLGANPALDRRLKVIARLEEQKALLNDPKYTRTIRTSVKKDAERTVTEKHTCPSMVADAAPTHELEQPPHT